MDSQSKFAISDSSERQIAAIGIPLQFDSTIMLTSNVSAIAVVLHFYIL